MEPEATKKQSLPYLALLIILVVVGIYFFLNKPVTETSTVTNTVATNIDDGGEESEPTTTEEETMPNEVKITIEGSSYKFSPNTISAKIGDKVIVEFKNIEGFHDFKIDEFNAATKVIKTGETDTVEFIVDKAGTFEFYCSVGEHRNMGMVGALTVTE
ncbi:MAG: Blue (Type 1) copper domain-containing protein [candidate division WWE3 bacterium GW2011_GWF1_42_14]|uniref:Blue (Type 1) copper domain-containing protein n=2 Tax=Katanobacteria TaxID=422282 RepID=A0A0G0YN78_UNCKA|nr:MAG: Blue (Type 1) copper domain-containing protein [candidate division WWE3 bacterium GW2011_GWA1_42_12]KKS34789.1 MAG: Blue (Type 1) copper domain-containing protein [candidate division WWE3 bacterium GW2011_GWD1_42_14]KKS38172.1 MAG: Blue (Type 1) copper domain-containing protein [candidate division WWE3 bacterium GW2011_GWF1_42_14]KKS40309.1 MAG: Blue (Type 1) copper domain-containing protein [candidate division WWE3 bacterium GW2011_GWE1_42_16]KKS67144.1 MAG: Blue (Type 1) copper domain